jgi:hypothetical protein
MLALLIGFQTLIRLIQEYLQSSYFFGRQFVCAQTAIFFLRTGLQEMRQPYMSQTGMGDRFRST